MNRSTIHSTTINGNQRSICNTSKSFHPMNNKSIEMDVDANVANEQKHYDDEFCSDDTMLKDLDTQIFGEFPQMDYMELRKDPQYRGFNNIVGKSWIYPTNFPIRQYQYNITRVCLFKNTLVVLPTGLGKTFIAAVVMFNMYRWYPLGKVIFMAPTRPLVTQQIEACYRIMGITKNDTAELTGKINKTLRRNLWQTKRVFFVTPQIVVSDLNDPDIAFPIDAIKLIVVDEAHRAKGKYAYTEVIQQIYSRNKMFRILALSATPGRRLEDVAEVLQNLLISHIEVRAETSIDVMQYTHKKNMKTIVVKMDQRLLDIRKDFINVIDPYVKILLEFNVISSNTHNLNKGWLLLELKRFRENSFVQRHPHHATIQSTFSTCISLYHALELLDRHGVRVFLNFFDDNSNSTEEKYFVAKDGYLKGLLHAIRATIKDKDLFSMNDSVVNKFNQNSIVDTSTRNESMLTTTELNEPIDFGHPKFEILRKNVLEHFQLNPLSRIIIFCEFRESVLLIHKLLLQNRPLIKAKIFIGQGSTTAGMRPVTQKQQIQIMNDFRLGTINTLIATCVAEEGIDVGEVDLIICFDINTKNPTRFVQRIGRTGRKRQGKVIMLATEGKEYDTLREVLATKDKTNQKLSKSTEILRVLYKFSPRLVPPEFDPMCVETPMEIPVENIETSTAITKKPKGTKRKLSKKDIAKLGLNENPEDDEDCPVNKKKSKIKNNKTPKGMRNVGSYFKAVAVNVNDIDEQDRNIFCTGKINNETISHHLQHEDDAADDDVINKLIKKLNRTRLKYLNKIPLKTMGKTTKKRNHHHKKQSINEIDIIFNEQYLNEWKQFLILKHPIEFKKHYENKIDLKVTNKIDQIFETDRSAFENCVLNNNNDEDETIDELIMDRYIPSIPYNNNKNYFSRILDDLENFIIDDDDDDPNEAEYFNNSEACLRILNEPLEYLQPLNCEENSIELDLDDEGECRKKLQYDEDNQDYDVHTPNIFLTPITNDYEIKSEYNNQKTNPHQSSPPAAEAVIQSHWRNSDKFNNKPCASTPIKKSDPSEDKSLIKENKSKTFSNSPIRINNPIVNLFQKWENKKKNQSLIMNLESKTVQLNPKSHQLLNYFLLKSIDDLFYCNRNASSIVDVGNQSIKKDFNQSLSNIKDFNQSITNKKPFNQSMFKTNPITNESSLKKSLNLFNDSFHNTCNELLLIDITENKTNINDDEINQSINKNQHHKSIIKNNNLPSTKSTTTPSSSSSSIDLFSDNSLFKNSIINMVIDDDADDAEDAEDAKDVIVDEKKLNKILTPQNPDRSVTVTQIMKILDEGDRMEEKKLENRLESINTKPMNQSSMFGNSNSMTKQIDIIDDINDLFDNNSSDSADDGTDPDKDFIDLTIDNEFFEEILEKLPDEVVPEEECQEEDAEQFVEEEEEEDFIESSQPIQDSNIILKKITRPTALDIHHDDVNNKSNINLLITAEEKNGLKLKKTDSQIIPIITLPSSSKSSSVHSTSSITLSNELNTAFTNCPFTSLDFCDEENDSILKQNTQLVVPAPPSASPSPSHLTPPSSSYRDTTTNDDDGVDNNNKNQNEYPSPSLLFKRNINFSRLKLYETATAAKKSPDIIIEGVQQLINEENKNTTIILEDDDDDDVVNRNESTNDPQKKSILSSSSLDDSIVMVGIKRNRKRIISESSSASVSAVSSPENELIMERKLKSNKCNQQFRKSKKKRLKHLFIDDEAAVSGNDDDQEEEEEETNGMELSNLICNTIVECDPNVDMQAKYLQSVRSPLKNRGVFRIPDVKRYANNNINIFSQTIDQTVGEYIKDSFVVHSSDTESENDCNIGNHNRNNNDNNEMSPLQKAEMILAQKRKQKRTLKYSAGNNSFKRRRKIISLNSSTSSSSASSDED